MKVLLLFFAFYGLVSGSTAHCGNTTTLVQELEEMLNTDQSLRRNIQKMEVAYGSNSKQVEVLWEKQTVLDAANIARLKEIIAIHGWPRISVVGDQAALAAFMVVQHANTSHQKALLPLLRKEAKRGEIKPKLLALLEDRVLTSDGKPQIYGSQLRRNSETDQMEFFPIEAAESVNSRRASVGLEPIEVYARRFGFEYKSGKGG